MSVEWHPTASGGMLHAVIHRDGLPNRNSLCYLVCELPPYSRHVQDKLDKQRKPQKCSNCLRKMQAYMQEGES